MTKINTTGRFVWHELVTPDVKDAVAFYGELFGWKAESVPMGPGYTYTMLKLGDEGVGGMTAPQPGDPPQPYWRTYCTTPDVDAATKRATELGGKVIVPPMDIPNVGRFSAVADPQGAVLMPFKDANERPELEGMPAPGTFCWDELLTSDPAAAATFYAGVYGFAIEEKDMGPMGAYRILKRGERMAGGIMKNPMPAIPSHWSSYVAVANLEASVKRAETLKGKVIVPPSDIPGMGRFAVLLDRAGAAFELFQGNG